MRNGKLTKIKKVVFIGSKKLGLAVLKLAYDLAPQVLAAAVTLNDTSDTRSVYEDFKSFCRDKKIKNYTVINKKDFNDVIVRLKPDFCLVCGWYWLLDKEILDLIPYGSVGLHGSLLPKYRGGSPLVWAMINGEKKTGISLFSFEKGMDNGDIWAQERVKINDTDYISDVLETVEKEAVVLLKKNYNKILLGTIKPKSQNHKLATYCAQRIPEDGKIDWQKSAREIYNFIRAQSEPYPGAFTFFKDKKLTIWRAEPSCLIYYGTAGQIAKRDSDGVYVICGDQRPIVLQTVQLEGSQKGPASEIIKSIKIRFQ